MLLQTLRSHGHRLYCLKLETHCYANRGKRVRSNLFTDVHKHRFKNRHELDRTAIANALDKLQWSFLTIDDICDDSDIRRNQPARHCVVGKSKAINDGLLMLMSSLHEVRETHIGAHVTNEMIESTAWATLGQVIDLQCTVQPVSHTVEQWEEMCVYKTARYSFFLPTVAALPSLCRGDRAQLLQVCDKAGVLYQACNDLQGLEVDKAHNKLTWFSAHNSYDTNTLQRYLTHEIVNLKEYSQKALMRCASAEYAQKKVVQLLEQHIRRAAVRSAECESQ